MFAVLCLPLPLRISLFLFCRESFRFGFGHRLLRVLGFALYFLCLVPQCIQFGLLHCRAGYLNGRSRFLEREVVCRFIAFHFYSSLSYQDCFAAKLLFLGGVWRQGFPRPILPWGSLLPSGRRGCALG